MTAEEHTCRPDDLSNYCAACDAEQDEELASYASESPAEPVLEKHPDVQAEITKLRANLSKSLLGAAESLVLVSGLEALLQQELARQVKDKAHHELATVLLRNHLANIEDHRQNWDKEWEEWFKAECVREKAGK